MLMLTLQIRTRVDIMLPHKHNNNNKNNEQTYRTVCVLYTGPALTIAGPYAKRIACVGISIIIIVVITAGPLEVRRPLRPHTLQWHKAGPGYTWCIMWTHNGGCDRLYVEMIILYYYSK